MFNLVVLGIGTVVVSIPPIAARVPLADVTCGDKTAGENRDKTLHCNLIYWWLDDAGVCGWGFSNDGPENDFGEMKHSLPDISNKLY